MAWKVYFNYTAVSSPWFCEKFPENKQIFPCFDEQIWKNFPDCKMQMSGSSFCTGVLFFLISIIQPVWKYLIFFEIFVFI